MECFLKEVCKEKIQYRKWYINRKVKYVRLATFKVTISHKIFCVPSNSWWWRKRRSL